MSHADKRARVSSSPSPSSCIKVSFGEAANCTKHTFAVTAAAAAEAMIAVQTPDGGEAHLAISTDDRGVPRTLGHGAYGTVLWGTLRTGADASTRTVAVKLQPANADEARDDLVDSDVIIEGAVLAATTRRGGPAAGIPALRATALLECTCCTEPPLAFALFACDVAPGEALSMRSCGLEGAAGAHEHRFALKGRELRLLALNLARTLAFLHSLSIYHGDLKPMHVLLEPRTKRVSLIDYGLACDVGRVRRDVYTVWWRPPEAWAPARAHEVGTASDVWAYALCVVAAAHAHPLMRPTTADEARWAMRTLQRRVREVLSADRKLGALMCRCLEDDPARRPTAHELVCTLQTLLGVADGEVAASVVTNRSPPVSPMSIAGTPPPQATRCEGAAAAAAACTVLDMGPLERCLAPFCELTLNKDALSVVGDDFLVRATERVRESAEHIFVRLSASAATWPNRREAAIAAMGLALRLHWPVPALALSGGGGAHLDFHVSSTYAGYDHVLTELSTPAEATALLERALVELRWDVLF